jgi:hypothetical protein
LASGSQHRPPRLGHDELLAAQERTVNSPRRHYGLPARFLFVSLDLIYGRRRTLSKFKVLELIARVPYQAWEQVAYIAVTHMYRRPDLARRIHGRVEQTRAQQDNEQWHLLILEELIDRAETQEGRLKYFWLPQLIAFVYYQVSVLLYVLRPVWSYRLNADFEDHAEHEYMAFVGEHPEWESVAFESAFGDDYGHFDSQADLFRQIGHDERIHKLESEDLIATARFK